jgi:gliding motility-associated-like protein
MGKLKSYSIYSSTLHNGFGPIACLKIFYLGQMEMARDQKIYIVHPYGNQISVIDNCDSSTPSFSKITSLLDGSVSMSSIIDKNDSISNNFYFFDACIENSTSFVYPNTTCWLHTYQWNFGDPVSGGQNISTLQNPFHQYASEGNYTVTLIIDAGSPASRTIINNVSIGSHHNFILGNDTLICKGDKIKLQGPQLPNTDYYWSTGDTTNVIYIKDAGNYVLTMNNSGCIRTDTIIIQAKVNQRPSLGADVYICDSSSILLSTHASSPNTVWSTGAINTFSLSVTAPGDYWAEVSDLGCTIRDSIKVFPAETLNHILGNDTTICKCEDVVFNIDIPNSTVGWWSVLGNFGYGIANSGVIITEIQFSNCSVYDTVAVQVASSPNLSLGPDVNSCEGSVATLSANYTVGSLAWSTGQTSPQITVSTPGIYTANISSPCGNVSDEVRVVFNKYPISNLPNELFFCEPMNESINTGNPNCQHIWSNGQYTESININHQGVYSVIIDNQGCITKDTVTVKVNPFKDYTELPNVITPDNDNINDYLYFKNYSDCSFFEAEIFDRWGKKVVSSSDPMNTWRPEDHSAGVYYYIVKYSNPCQNNEVMERKGFIHLVR